MKRVLGLAAMILVAAVIILIGARSHQLAGENDTEVTRSGGSGVSLPAPADQQVAESDSQKQKPGAKPRAIGNLRKISAKRRPPVAIEAVSDPFLPIDKSGREWDFSTYQGQTGDIDVVDGKTAYLAYDYVKSCIGLPRSEDEFELRIEQYNVTYEQNSERIGSKRFELALENLQAGYLRCDGLDNKDLVETATQWLQLSADLGYLQAQLGFYQELPELLRQIRGRVFLQPHYLDLHRTKSLQYLQEAIVTGHPQAFRMYAMAILDDVLFVRDDLAAYAHLVAADLAAGGMEERVRQQINVLESRLSTGRILRGRRWGRSLCLEYCAKGLTADEQS